MAVTQLDRIEAGVDVLLFVSGLLLKEGSRIMSLEQDALDHIAAQGTTLDSIAELVKQLVSSGDLSPAAAAAFQAALAANDAKLNDIEAALQAAPPTP